MSNIPYVPIPVFDTLQDVVEEPPQDPDIFSSYAEKFINYVA